MESYIVNDLAKANGEHEVHRASCVHVPSYCSNLGLHAHGRSALVAARERYPTAQWCKACCEERE
jgi:hypothetical protein